MKILIFGMSLFLVSSMSFSLTAQQDTNNKEFLLNYFEETARDLKKELTGLSEDQMHFKPSPDQWSVSQGVEHIVLTEKMLYDMAKAEMDKPASPERRKEVKVKDEQLIQGIKDRSHKVQASDELVGDGTYNTPEEAIAEFEKQRKIILDYIALISLEDLRSHISDSPFGPVDAYQSLLFIAGHTARHTLQIKEVKAHGNFAEKQHKS